MSNSIQYSGVKNTTHLNKPCVAWPDSPEYGGNEKGFPDDTPVTHNYCRNRPHEGIWPWCPQKAYPHYAVCSVKYCPGYPWRDISGWKVRPSDSQIIRWWCRKIDLITILSEVTCMWRRHLFLDRFPFSSCILGFKFGDCSIVPCFNQNFVVSDSRDDLQY